jgi:hypothetical protein
MAGEKVYTFSEEMNEKERTKNSGLKGNKRAVGTKLRALLM